MPSASSSSGNLAPAPAEVVIRPAERWGSLQLREVWEHRELLYILTRRELQIRYKQSFVGIGWAVLQPITLTFVFALFLGRLANVGSEGLPYPVFALTAFVPWLFLSQSVTLSAGSLVAEAEMLTKIYFPRVIVPVSKILSLVVDLVIALVVVIVATLLFGLGLQATTPLILPFLGLAFAVAIGVGVLLAALNVRYRD